MSNLKIENSSSWEEIDNKSQERKYVDVAKDDFFEKDLFNDEIYERNLSFDNQIQANFVSNTTNTTNQPQSIDNNIKNNSISTLERGTDEKNSYRQRHPEKENTEFSNANCSYSKNLFNSNSNSLKEHEFNQTNNEFGRLVEIDDFFTKESSPYKNTSKDTFKENKNNEKDESEKNERELEPVIIPQQQNFDKANEVQANSPEITKTKDCITAPTTVNTIGSNFILSSKIDIDNLFDDEDCCNSNNSLKNEKEFNCYIPNSTLDIKKGLTIDKNYIYRENIIKESIFDEENVDDGISNVKILLENNDHILIRKQQESKKNSVNFNYNLKTNYKQNSFKEVNNYEKVISTDILRTINETNETEKDNLNENEYNRKFKSSKGTNRINSNLHENDTIKIAKLTENVNPQVEKKFRKGSYNDNDLCQYDNCIKSSSTTLANQNNFRYKDRKSSLISNGSKSSNFNRSCQTKLPETDTPDKISETRKSFEGNSNNLPIAKTKSEENIPNICNSIGNKDLKDNIESKSKVISINKYEKDNSSPGKKINNNVKENETPIKKSNYKGAKGDLCPCVGVGIFVVDQKRERLLLGKRIDSGLYGLPGGWLEYGEEWEEAASRELLEECGINKQASCFKHIYTLNYYNQEKTFHAVSCVMYSSIEEIELEELDNKEPNKCYGWFWISLSEMRSIINQLFPPLRMFIKKYPKIQKASEFKTYFKCKIDLDSLFENEDILDF